ncbi:ribonucleotide-diphosphate reductase subunit alpha, partial [Bacteroides ovatus]
FKGKNIVTFDDVITRGITWATYSDQLENLGAHVLSGIFLAKTHYKVKTN